MFNTGAISSLIDHGVKSNRQWVPNQLYSGRVLSIQEDGSIEVLINNQVYQALAHKFAQPGDQLSLRLLGTEPKPYFAIVGVLQRVRQPEPKVQTQAGWLEAVSLLRNFDPGIAGLAALWQRYPQQLARLSPQLPQLLLAICGKAIPAEDLLIAGKLKAYALGSGSFYESEAENTDTEPDMKPLLFRLLGALQHKRLLTLINGRAVFVEKPGLAAQSLQDRSAALYANEQESESGSKTLRQLLCLNVENALLQLVSGQVTAINRSDSNFPIWIMRLTINYQQLMVPLELEFRQKLQVTPEHWEAIFSLELPHSGRIYAELLVKKPAVSLRLSSHNPELPDLWLSHKSGLNHMLEKLGLELEEFHCTYVEAAYA